MAAPVDASNPWIALLTLSAFAMAFALAAELLNMRLRKVHKPVHLPPRSEQRIATELSK